MDSRKPTLESDSLLKKLKLTKHEEAVNCQVSLPLFTSNLCLPIIRRNNLLWHLREKERKSVPIIPPSRQFLILSVCNYLNIFFCHQAFVNSMLILCALGSNLYKLPISSFTCKVQVYSAHTHAYMRTYIRTRQAHIHIHTHAFMYVRVCLSL